MPITVPEDRSVDVGGIPATRMPEIADSTPDAGGAAAGAIASGIEGAAGSVRDYAAEQQRNANETALTGLDLEASREQTRIETQARQMKGQDALHAPSWAADQWNQVQSRLKEKAANQSQALGLQKLMAQRSEGLDKVVQTHSADQLTQFDNAQTEAALAAYSDEAIHNYQDPDRLAEVRDKQDAQIDLLARRMGWSDLQVQQKKAETNSLTNTSIVMRMLDNGDYKSAQAYYNDNKDQFVGKDQLSVDKNLEEGKMRSIGMDAWGNVQGLKLADGNPDEAAQERAVMNRDDLTDSEKEKVVAYVKQRANTFKVDKAMQDRATDRSFLNAAIKLRQQGVSLDAASPMARNFSTDAYDQALKQQQLNELWAPSEVKTDPATKVAIYDGIDAGNVDKAQIQKAYDSKQLSGSDYVTAMEKYRQNVIDGKNPQQQRMNEQLKAMAKTQFGSDTATANQWLSEMKTQGYGKPVDEQYKMAQDSIKSDQSSVSRFWNWVPVVGGDPIPGTGESQFQTDVQKRQNDQLMRGQLQQDLGPDTVKGIDVGNQALGNGQTTTQTIQDLSVALGGYDNLKPGKPAYNAMQSLIRANKVVTPDAVRAVLANYPDGNFTVQTALPASNRIGRLPRVRK